MDKTQFIKMFQEFEEEFKSEGGYPLTISSDKSIDARIIIDEDGFIWIRDYESWRRAKTPINVQNIVEFRKSEIGGYYIICDDDTGLSIDDDIYYCIYGAPSGRGHAFGEFYNK